MVYVFIFWKAIHQFKARLFFCFFEDILNLILFVISDNLWGEFQSVVADPARVVNVGVVNRS